MTKFKIGDKVKLKADATFWGENHLELKKKVFTVGEEFLDGDGTVTVIECVAEYPDDFELVLQAPQKHIHHDMIVQWAANPCRVVQFRTSVNYPWTDASEILWNPNAEYRFKPEEPERVFPATSLTEYELHELYMNNSPHDNALKAIANTAIKRYILEQVGKEEE